MLLRQAEPFLHSRVSTRGSAARLTSPLTRVVHDVGKRGQDPNPIPLSQTEVRVQALLAQASLSFGADSDKR